MAKGRGKEGVVFTQYIYIYIYIYIYFNDVIPTGKLKQENI